MKKSVCVLFVVAALGCMPNVAASGKKWAVSSAVAAGLVVTTAYLGDVYNVSKHVDWDLGSLGMVKKFLRKLNLMKRRDAKPDMPKANVASDSIKEAVKESVK
jgi:hypothetical protein